MGEDPELVEDSRSPADRGGHGGPRKPELRERPQPEDEARVEHDVDPVREPERPHRGLGVPRSPQDGVVQEQQDDRGHPRVHDPGVGGADRDRFGVRSHQGQHAGSEDHPDDTERQGHHQPEPDRLHARARRSPPVPLAVASRHHRGDREREPDRQRVHQADRGFGDPRGSERRSPEAGDEERVHHGEDRLADHLERHRDREHEHRGGERAGRQVAVGTPQRFDNEREQASRPRARGHGDVGRRVTRLPVRTAGRFAEGAHARVPDQAGGISATIRTGAPVPASIFMGRAISRNPVSGTSERSPTFSRLGIPAAPPTWCTMKSVEGP